MVRHKVGVVGKPKTADKKSAGAMAGKKVAGSAGPVAREFDRRISSRCREEEQAAFIAEQIGQCADEIGKSPCDVSWWDFRAYGGIAWGKSRIGIAQRLISSLGGFKVIRDAYFAREATDLSVTRQRAREHANLNRRLGHAAADSEFQFRQIEAFAAKIFKGRIEPASVPRAARPVKGRRFKRELVICLGDWHLGADIQAEETGDVNFGPLEEARRCAQIVYQVCTYKPEYREETSLRVVLLGDFFHGCLHDLKDGAVLSEQKSRAIHLFIQMFAHFSAAFRKVTVEAITGNHGRDKTRHHKPATSGKWDSHEMFVYSAVRKACWSLKNIEWHLPKAAFGTFTIFGKHYFYTHGDSVFKASTNDAELERQANALNATLRDREEYAVVLLGHAHKYRDALLNNGVRVIINGPFTPLDAYAVSIGIYESACSQKMFEVVEGFPVGDSRLIILDKKVDEDASLDKLITAWDGF